MYRLEGVLPPADLDTDLGVTPALSTDFAGVAPAGTVTGTDADAAASWLLVFSLYSATLPAIFSCTCAAFLLTEAVLAVSPFQ